MEPIQSSYDLELNMRLSDTSLDMGTSLESSGGSGISSSSRIDLQVKSTKITMLHPGNEKTIRTMATLSPDEIILWNVKDNAGKQKVYTGVLFFADVAAFTDLCERLTKSGKRGASRITKILNEYIGVMVQEIMSHNGDLLKFSGDAFLALWTQKAHSSSISDVVHAAIDCALSIQKSHGQYETDVGTILKVKIAIASGQIIIAVVGDSTFMVFGDAMLEVKNVANECSAGDIIISPDVKMFLKPNHYIMENIHGLPFIKVLGIDSDWTSTLLSGPAENMFDETKEERGKSSQKTETGSDISMVEEFEFAYKLRPSIDYAVNENLEDYLTKFIIPPVQLAIEAGEPLDNLTEMRQVVIVFVNVVTEVFGVKQLEDLLEDTYSKVYEEVSITGGCVNKVSMFDKDLMFLVIFGLRGFKDKLEAQKALYCSKKIRERLVHTNQVLSASIGVTTGSTYCGVVGHPMRKEYTVIGRTVNKAARLMCNYPDMVTCDRQTFLESQLQSRYFTLQPTRYLKGFNNVGPIYKFDDNKSAEYIMEKEMLKTNMYPLLDRPRELAMFFRLLHEKTPDHSTISLLAQKMCPFDLYKSNQLDTEIMYKMMVLEGAPRWGKSRVLNEITYYVKNEIPHYKCTLDRNSRKYKLFRSIFGDGCKITNVKNIKTRTKYVWRMLVPFKVPQFLCALNDMLYLSFEVTAPYERLNEKQILFVRQQMVKYLSRRIFKTFSLVTIDNIEYLDDESWLLYKEIFDSENIFTCATITKGSTLPNESNTIMNSPSTVCMTLLRVKECYHGALICQFLNVRGISLELERYVQKHCYGNPGWIESFLLSLRHSKILKRIDLERSQAYLEGFVLPDIEFLHRPDLRTRQARRSVYTFEAESPFTGTPKDIEEWDMYKEIIPDNENETENCELTSICTLEKNCSLDLIETEEQYDILMVRTYDSLDVEAQHVLKCSAIIGNEFTRCQLEYVMQESNVENTSIAIAKLFEIKIFGCLRGTYNGGDIIVRHTTRVPNEEQEIKCECEGFPENCMVYESLPKYANCNYICFREPAFRLMCTNLLTETQANLYHIRSIWYLENKTKRCYSCELQYFTHINGQSNDDGLNHYSLQVFPGLSDNSVDLNTIHTRMNFVAGTADSEWSFLKYEANWMDSTKLIQPRTFLHTNLKDCRCANILISMYCEIIEHNQELGRNQELMNSLLEYALLCIRNNNIAVAITLTAKANILLNDKLIHNFLEPEWQLPITKGRILTLRAVLELSRNAYKNAEMSSLLALKTYNLHFPRNKRFTKIAIRYYEFKQKVMLLYYPEKYIGSEDDDMRLLAEQTALTLTTLYEIYIRQEKYDLAYLASLWALIEALRSNTNFYLLCCTYKNASIMDCTYNRPRIIKKIEEMAIETCYRKLTRLEIFEYEAVVDMYVAIYRRKTLCENFYNNLWLGTVINRINCPNYGGFYNLKAPSIYIKCMCYTYHLKNAVKFIRHMLGTVNVATVKGIATNPMPIYLLCVEFMSVTTFNIVPIHECKQSFLLKIEPLTTSKLTIIEMKFYILLWIWYLRREEWQSSVNIYNHVSEMSRWPQMQDPELAYTNCDLLEGLLLLLVRKMNIGDLARIVFIEKFIIFLFKRIKTFARTLKSLKSRYWLYWAHYINIHGHKNKATKILNKAEQYAEKCSNYFERDWIRHNREAWANWPESALNDKWIASAKRDTLLKDDLDDKIYVFFTLRLPVQKSLRIE